MKEVSLSIGWTTVATLEEAEALGRKLVAASLAACVQIDAPVRSIYKWDGEVQGAQEVRLWIKFLKERAAAVEAAVMDAHPYETPQWIVVDADAVSEAYAEWARDTGGGRADG